MRRGTRSGRERGNAAIIVAITLVVIGGFLALGLNVGHFMSVRSQLQNAVDAGAMAGAQSLDGTPAGIAEARRQAHDFTERHLTLREAVVIGTNDGNDLAGDIVFGSWDPSLPKESAFTPISNPEAVAPSVNAVLVRAGREEARGNPLPVFFSVFLGQTTASVTAEAVAVGGGECTRQCPMPIAFADCVILKPDGTVDCGKVLTMASSTVDNIGFTNLAPDEAAVNPPTLIDILSGNCRGVQVGDNIGVGNGNNLTGSVIHAFQAYIDTYGAQVKAPIISPGTCPDPQFNRRQPVVGFATFTIDGFDGPPDRGIRLRLECDLTDPDPSPAGCDFFGTPGQVRLGR